MVMEMKFLNADLDVVVVKDCGIIDYLSKKMILVSRSGDRYSFELKHPEVSPQACVESIVCILNKYQKNGGDINEKYCASIDFGFMIENKEHQYNFVLNNETIKIISDQKIDIGITIYNR